mmetsp:Transcript_110832/g.180778  ORF Transcript_110832/g.180778 Transcript_110832/m.180778 type:complete len:225 (-) Transcript_110832:150-824(-)
MRTAITSGSSILPFSMLPRRTARAPMHLSDFSTAFAMSPYCASNGPNFDHVVTSFSFGGSGGSAPSKLPVADASNVSHPSSSLAAAAEPPTLTSSGATTALPAKCRSSGPQRRESSYASTVIICCSLATSTQAIDFRSLRSHSGSPSQYSNTALCHSAPKLRIAILKSECSGVRGAPGRLQVQRQRLLPSCSCTHVIPTGSTLRSHTGSQSSRGKSGFITAAAA